MPDKHYSEVIFTSLSTVLPQVIEQVIESYCKFVCQNVENTAKDFSSHHAACKAALVHLNALIKITNLIAKQKADNSNSDDSFLKLVQEARLQLLKAGQNHE